VIGQTFRVRALLFDLDGTLVDSDPMHERTWAALLKSYGIAVDAALYRTRFSGRLNPEIVAEFLPQLDRAANLALCEEKESLFRRLTPRLEPLPGVTDVIARARRQGVKTAVVTNAPRVNVDHMLGALDLAHGWDTQVVADEIGIGKPDPGPYREALRRFGLAPEEAIAFEDSASGVRAASGAGIHTVGLLTSHSETELRAAGARTIARDFTDPALAELARASR
jgi:HAD superfamily hydrolase (TIGR01509 family)